ncbi:MAG: glycosyltransferase involved in cell wall biosynthesis [Candidatus Azotimanducaceae bacterium]|jgi:glycosyltransferase involved in cell wall biosynthesis
MTESSSRPAETGLRVLLFEQPARTSNKYEIWAGMPETHVTIVSDRDGWGADETVVCAAVRMPFIGGFEGWTAAPALLRGLGEIDPSSYDVIASHELYSFTTAQAARFAARAGKPHVIHISETMPKNIVYRLPPYSLITKRTVRSASWFACTTERARRHAIALGCDPDRCSVVHSGVDMERFHPNPAGLVSDPELLFVGMLRANRGADKGVLDLVAAVDRLKGQGTDLRLSIAGDGHLREELEEMAATRGHLEIRGRVPRDEIAGMMRSSRVLILPSKRTWKWEEQFGFVLAEAMASGLPVVGTKSGSIPEVVAPWNPLVDEGDIAALADGIWRALGSDGDDWGDRNRQWAIDHFSLTTQAERLRDVMVSAVSSAPRS